MTRKSLSITQEQLCDGICSIETLSRIETGRQSPSRDTYELLMERMGRIRERAYSMLSVSDFKVLEKMKLFEDYIKLYDYHRAETVLNKIKKTLGNTVLDRQFLMRGENLVNYRLNRITVNEFLEGLQDAIRLTIPKYGEISLANWPLNLNEAGLLINISTAYAEKEDYYKAIGILEEASSALKQSYMEDLQRATIQTIILNNLSKCHGLIGNHEKAIEIAKEGISISKTYKLGNVLSNMLYNISWNLEQLIKKGLLPQDKKQDCLSYLEQAYYIASAMQQPFIEKFIENHLKTNYEGTVTNL
jgi:tetratricopeptide (TPR) repeat protein